METPNVSLAQWIMAPNADDAFRFSIMESHTGKFAIVRDENVADGIDFDIEYDVKGSIFDGQRASR